jgi:hypothetical protein
LPRVGLIMLSRRRLFLQPYSENCAAYSATSVALHEIGFVKERRLS